MHSGSLTDKPNKNITNINKLLSCCVVCGGQFCVRSDEFAVQCDSIPEQSGGVRQCDGSQARALYRVCTAAASHCSRANLTPIIDEDDIKVMDYRFIGKLIAVHH